MLLCLSKYIMYTLEKVDHIIYFKVNILNVFSIKTGSSLICTYVNVPLTYTPSYKYILAGFKCCRYNVDN